MLRERDGISLTLLLPSWHDPQPLCLEPPPGNLSIGAHDKNSDVSRYLCSLIEPSFYPGSPQLSPMQVAHPVEQILKNVVFQQNSLSSRAIDESGIPLAGLRKINCK